MGRKKPFIEKGEGVKFYLVNRSQKDPLYLDESLGEHVLVPVEDNVRKDLVDKINGLNLNQPKMSDSEKEIKIKARLDEQKKFGVYYEDNYNYLQHLREIDEHEIETAELDKPDLFKNKNGDLLFKNEIKDDKIPQNKLQLPSTVFATQFEEEVGYFNQAAPDHDPKIHWDPEVVRLLDEDVDIDFEDAENFLDDDFFKIANKPDISNIDKNLKNKSLNVDEDFEGNSDDCDFNSDEGEKSDNDDFFDDYAESESVRDFDKKSRFSEYSMTSSVIKRNDKLRCLDDQFENLYAQYDEDQIGGLEMEEIDGYRGLGTEDLVLESALAEFEISMKKKVYVAPPVKKTNKPKLDVLKEEDSNEEDSENSTDEDKDSDEDDTECGSDSGEDTDDETKHNKQNYEAKHNYEMVRLKTKKELNNRLDCESILSTYSTIYNHPGMITEKRPVIELSKKSGLPLGILSDKPITKKMMDKIEHKITRILPEVPIRGKDETKEEKKARKNMIKEHRRERRVEKKINQIAFKKEEKIQICQIANQANQIKLPL